MTVSIRLRSGVCLAVVLVVSACAGGAPSVEPPPLGEPPQRSAVSPTSVTAGGGNGSLGTVSSSTVVSPPVVPTTPGVPPTEFGGDLGGVFVDVSAGFGYSCGLREGGGVECWEWGGASVPSDWWDRVLRRWSEDTVGAVVPGGVFVSVSAGFGNACGLRPSGVLVCWGRKRDVVVSAPEGVFTEVSVGLEHACGVRIDEKVTCWGSTSWRQPVDFPPEGVFVDFALAKSFGCGVRVGGSVECWGDGYTAGGTAGELPLPEGDFQSVYAGLGNFNVCGLRTDERVECWGNFIEVDVYNPYLSPPEGEFSSILFVGSFSCGLRPGGEGECWSVDGSSWAPPEPGDYPDAVYGEGNACGYVYGVQYCWESGTGLPEEVTGIVEGFNYLCGLRPGGEVVCDYFDDYFVPYGERYLYRFPQGESPVEPPEGPFTALVSSFRFVCGLRPGGTVECWGTNTYGESSPPEGRFTQIKAGHSFACGLRPSGELECWGYGGYRSRIIPSRGALTAVHAGWGGLEVRRQTGTFSSRRDWGYSCGLRPDRSVECWGDLGPGGRSRAVDDVDTAIRVHHPEGEFTEVGVGKQEACGLRPSGVVECWGAAWMNPEDWSPAHDVRGGEGEGYEALSVGGEYSCALLRGSGAVDCWSTDRSETYQLAGPYTAVSAGYGHQCGVLTTGDIHCWEGKNSEERWWGEITIPAEEEN